MPVNESNPVQPSDAPVSTLVHETRRSPSQGSSVAVTAALLALVGACVACGPIVKSATFRQRPESVKPASVLGGFDGRVIDADSKEPIEDDPLLRACALTYVSDLGMVDIARPPGQLRPGPGGAATLDHSLWLHRPFDPHQWHRYDATGVSHSDARGMAFGSIRDESGRLVASAAQESLWRI